MRNFARLTPQNYRMRIYKVLFFLGLLALTACSRSVPKGIIPPDEMAPLIADLHIIDGTLYTKSQAPDTLYKYGLGNYIAAFKRHHVDSAQFNKSFRYYTNQPKLFAEVYDQAIKIIQAKYDSVGSIKSKNGIQPAPALPPPTTKPNVAQPNAVPAK